MYPPTIPTTLQANTMKSPTPQNDGKKSVSKEKLRTIMEAASALTALGDEESSSSANRSLGGTTSPLEGAGAAAVPKKEPSSQDEQRFIPDYKKPDAALTFPEKLMKMMRFAETQGAGYCIAWCEDGRSFIIRNPNEFSRTVVPMFFKPTKFSSFTRKLYRWGFRQLNRGLGPTDPVIFGCTHFQRDHPEDMANMRSVTAGSRKDDAIPVELFLQHADGTTGSTRQPSMVQPQPQLNAGTKRLLEDAFSPDDTSSSLQKRLLLSKLLQQQSLLQQQPTQPPGPLLPQLDPNSALALASLQHRPDLLGVQPHQRYSQPIDASQSTFKPSSYQQYIATQPHGYLQNQPALMGTLPIGSAFVGDSSRTNDIVNAAIAALRNA